MMKTIFQRILTSAALCLAAAGVGGCTEIRHSVSFYDHPTGASAS